MLLFKKEVALLRKIRRSMLNFFGIGDETPEPEDMPISAVKMLILLSVAMAVTIIISNMAALKIWELKIPYPTALFPIKEWEILAILPVDAGVWLFPITYLIGDLLVNTFGQKIANLVAVYVSAFTVVAAGILWLARYTLPDFPGADNSAFEIIQSATGRIFLASIVGFLAGQLVNNFWFTRIRECQTDEDDGRKVRARALISSTPAHLIDSVLFETLAFLGRLPLDKFVTQIIFAFIVGIVIEGLVSWKLTPYTALKLQRKLQYSNGKVIKS